MNLVMWYRLLKIVQLRSEQVELVAKIQKKIFYLLYKSNIFAGKKTGKKFCYIKSLTSKYANKIRQNV